MVKVKTEHGILRRLNVLPLLGFTKLKSKLLDGSKTQTIRKPRKHPLKIGDKLFIYWKLRTKGCEKLGDGIVTKVERKKTDDFTEEDALKDGFIVSREGRWLENSALTNLLMALVRMHPGIDGETEFDIITWDWICQVCKQQIQGVAHKSPEPTLCMDCYLKETKQ